MNSPENSYKNIINNIVWVLKLNFKYIPIPAFSRLVSEIWGFVSNLARAFILGLLVDWIIQYITNADSRFIVYSLVAFGIYYLFDSVMGIFRNLGHNLFGFFSEYVIPTRLLNAKLDKMQISSLENPTIQNLITRYQENRQIIDDVSRKTFFLIGTIIGLIVTIAPLMTVLPIVTLLLIGVSVPVVIFNKRIIGKLWDIEKETTVLSRRGGRLVGNLSDPNWTKEVKLLGAYNYLKKYFDEYVDTYFGAKKKLYKKWSIFDFVTSIVNVAVLLYGIYLLIVLVNNGQISPGQIIFFIGALTSVGNYLDTFAANFASFMGSNARLTEMRDLLDYKDEKTGSTIKIKQLISPTLLNLNNVSFAYPNSKKYVIENLDLTIKPGEKIAIVGENGAGKTTLVKLISGIYEATEGEIFANDYDLSKIDENSWFKNLGVLYQDYNTYNDLTAFENIALGRIEEELDYEKIKEAAQKADAHDFIMDYENNYSQVLSERYEGGIRPSTGQWQKIAIARFFYRNAPILILDEPTASIDAESEARIFDRIYKFIEDKTVIIISHRFSTVRNADRIIVFDKGKIIEQGSHEELLKINGKYAKAFKTQAKGYGN